MRPVGGFRSPSPRESLDGTVDLGYKGRSVRKGTATVLPVVYQENRNSITHQKKYGEKLLYFVHNYREPLQRTEEKIVFPKWLSGINRITSKSA